jgi:DNA/RNA endonuclease YhcR with UshA esterase domain
MEKGRKDERAGGWTSMLFHAGERELLIVSLAVSIIGLAALALYTSSITPRQVPLSEIAFTQIGSHIAASGIVKTIQQGDGTLALEVCDGGTTKYTTNCVEIRTFKSASLLIFEGDFVSASGTLKEWKGETYLEIKTPNDIEVIR